MVSSKTAQAAKEEPGIKWPTQSRSLESSSAEASIFFRSQSLISKSSTYTGKVPSEKQPYGRDKMTQPLGLSAEMFLL